MAELALVMLIFGMVFGFIISLPMFQEKRKVSQFVPSDVVDAVKDVLDKYTPKRIIR